MADQGFQKLVGPEMAPLSLKGTTFPRKTQGSTKILTHVEFSANVPESNFTSTHKYAFM